ncbi:hypothetical protein [Nocardia sp. NPDC004123]
MDIRKALRSAAEAAEDLLSFYFADHGVWIPVSGGLTYCTYRFDDSEWSTLKFDLVSHREDLCVAAVATVEDDDPCPGAGFEH